MSEYEVRLKGVRSLFLPQRVAMAHPRDWVARMNRPEMAAELYALWVSAQRGRPFGVKDWMRQMAKHFGMESMLRAHGR